MAIWCLWYRRGVGNNSIQCTSCQKWVHRKCSSIKGSMYKVMKTFICRGCMNPVTGTGYTSVDIGVNAYLELVDKFYLGDMLSVMEMLMQLWRTNHPYDDPLPGTTRVSWYQRGKNQSQSGFTGARYSVWKWYQLGHMQICTSPQTDNHASTHDSFLKARCPSCCPANSVKALKVTGIIMKKLVKTSITVYNPFEPDA